MAIKNKKGINMFEKYEDGLLPEEEMIRFFIEKGIENAQKAFEEFDPKEWTDECIEYAEMQKERLYNFEKLLEYFEEIY